MSKELIAWLREICPDVRGNEAADRIEELEQQLADSQKQNVLLREALDKAMRYDWADQDGAVPNEVAMQCIQALAATANQSNGGQVND